jgi:hypothetical protein
MNGYHSYYGYQAGVPGQIHGEIPRHVPHHEHYMQHHHQHLQHPFYQLKQETLMVVKPYVDYGMKEAQGTGVAHAMTEVAAIAYLIGKGMHPHAAYEMVESWEVNENF